MKALLLLSILLLALPVYGIFPAPPVVSTIDSAGQVGYGASMDAEGSSVYIAYFDYSAGYPNFRLKLSKSPNMGASWSSSTISSEGSPGEYLSLDADSSKVYVAYYTAYEGDLMLIKSQDGGATWTPPMKIDSYPEVAMTKSVGRYNSIQASGGKIFIAYYDSYNSSLRLARSLDDGLTWQYFPIANNEGYAASLRFSSGLLYVSYISGDYKTLKVAMSSDGGATWYSNTIATETLVGGFDGTSLDYSGGYLFVAVYNRARQKLVVHKLSSSLSPLLSTELGGTVGQYPSIDTYDNSNIFVSYYDSYYYDLRLSKSSDGGLNWDTVTMDSTGNTGKYTTLKAINSTAALIGYMDYTNGDLKLTTFQKLFTEPTTTSTSTTSSTSTTTSTSSTSTMLPPSTTSSSTTTTVNPTTTTTVKPTTTTLPLTTSTSSSSTTTSSSSTTTLVPVPTTILDTTTLPTTETSTTIKESTTTTIKTVIEVPVEETIKEVVREELRKQLESEVREEIRQRILEELENAETRAEAKAVIVSLKQGEEAVLRVKNQEIPVRTLSIQVNTPVNDIDVTIRKLDQKPEIIKKDVGETGTEVYKYVEIDAPGAKEKVSKVTIAFDVEKTWISENQREGQKIELSRYIASEDRWETLPTKKVSEDEKKESYEAVSKGFSVFVISLAIPVGTEPPPESLVTPVIKPQKSPLDSVRAFASFLLIIFLVVFGYIVFRSGMVKKKMF